MINILCLKKTISAIQALEFSSGAARVYSTMCHYLNDGSDHQIKSLIIR